MSNLKGIGKEMATQNNAGTQYPLWVIQEHYKDYVNYLDDWAYRERPDTDSLDYDYFVKGLCPSCKESYEENGKLKDDCNDCDDETYWYYNIELRLAVDTAGCFLTEKACQTHIDENAHHYWKGAHPYAISAWRNPEMVTVMQHLIQLSGLEIPNYYK